jgi:hypothetical protein
MPQLPCGGWEAIQANNNENVVPRCSDGVVGGGGGDRVGVGGTIVGGVDDADEAGTGKQVLTNARDGQKGGRSTL